MRWCYLAVVSYHRPKCASVWSAFGTYPRLGIPENARITRVSNARAVVQGLPSVCVKGSWLRPLFSSLSCQIATSCERGLRSAGRSLATLATRCNTLLVVSLLPLMAQVLLKEMPFHRKTSFEESSYGAPLIQASSCAMCGK